jgi:molecular chaperone DnaK (HSP70)
MERRNAKETLVLVSKTGDFLLTKDEAREVAVKISEGYRNIALQGAILATHSIDGILPYDRYRDSARIKNRGFICLHENFHRANEQCACSRLQAIDKNKQIDAKAKPTTEEEARGTAAREYIRENLKNPDALKDADAREAFVKKRTAEILAKNASDAPEAP